MVFRMCAAIHVLHVRPPLPPRFRLKLLHVYLCCGAVGVFLLWRVCLCCRFYVWLCRLAIGVSMLQVLHMCQDCSCSGCACVIGVVHVFVSWLL